MPEVFVAADWLADRLGDVPLVDVRDAWEYDGIGHLPGAVSVPFDAFRTREGGAGMLPPREDWHALLSGAGVAPGDDVVAYDDTHGVFAARFLVTAELLGHDPDRLHLLDGDYSAWSRDHEISRDEPDVAETDYRVDPLDETPQVVYETVLEAIDDDGTLLVDTREPWEFEDGHLPGAVQLDWMELVDDESRGLRDEGELREILESHGITPDRRILLYCNTARRISHTYLVLRHLGYADLAFYEGSLTEWVERGGPVETVE